MVYGACRTSEVSYLQVLSVNDNRKVTGDVKMG